MSTHNKITVKISDKFRVSTAHTDAIGHHAVFSFKDTDEESVFEHLDDGSVSVRVSRDSLLKLSSMINNLISTLDLRSDIDNTEKRDQEDEDKNY